VDKMKKLDLVKLVNEKPYLKNNLQKDMRGIVVDVKLKENLVLFFNPNNIDDYVIVNINGNDIYLEKEKLPTEIQKEVLSKLDNIKLKTKNYIEMMAINEYDMVELLIEDEKYTKLGVHKGDIGCVMDNKVVQNCIEVDFSGVDENGNFYGDCITVAIKDLKVIK